MTQPLLPLVESPPTRRRGRPPGAKNRRSADLARYVEATYGGMTPGQQAAELALVRPADLKKAKALAAELGIVDVDLPPLMLAMVVKAKQLAKALGVDASTAWVLLQKERADLLPYIHQKQAPMADKKGQPNAQVFLIPEGEAQQGQLPDFSVDEDAPIEFAGEFGVADTPVVQPKSYDKP